MFSVAVYYSVGSGAVIGYPLGLYEVVLPAREILHCYIMVFVSSTDCTFSNHFRHLIIIAIYILILFMQIVVFRTLLEQT